MKGRKYIKKNSKFSAILARSARTFKNKYIFCLPAFKASNYLTPESSCLSYDSRSTGKQKILPVVIFALNDRRHALATADTGIGAAVATTLGFENTGQGAGQPDAGSA